MSSEGKKGMNGGKFYYWCKCFIIVKAFNLGISFCDDLAFVSFDEPFRSSLQFECPSQVNNFVIGWPWNFLIYFHVLE
jgi:hypothetical protein